MSTIFRRVVFLTLFLVLAPTLAVRGTSSYLISGSPTLAESPLSASVTITVSGVVTGPGEPVPDVWVGVGSPLDWQETTTNASGFYSLSVQTDGQLWFHLRPDLSTRLAQVNLWMDGVAASFTQDFSLQDGYLLSLRPTLEGGTAADGIGFEVAALVAPLPEGQWYILEWDQTSQRYQAVLHQDVHYVTVWNPPPGYYPTTKAIDLRTGDQTVDIPLNTNYVHPIPDEPPDADKITFGTPDGLGEVVVNGAPGATLPLAHVLLVNLNSAHQAHAISAADGSFSAQIFAPPGSAVMVKHGPADPWRWHALDTGLSEGVNPYPGTIINLPHTHAGGGSELPFAAAGAVQHFIDDPAETRNYVSSAWAITGTLSSVSVPGEWQRLLDGFYAGEAVPGLYLGGLNWTHPALGDLDADGDLDLLVGERGGTLVYYRNQGNASFPDWTFEVLDYAGVNTGWWAYPTLADVTADGAPDLFVGHGDGTISVYFNVGTPASPSWPESPDVSLSAGEGAAPVLYDLDADGDLDLLAGHQGGTLFHYKNNGNASSPAWSLQSESYGGISEPDHGLQPTFVDLDSDGDQDLLIGRSGDLVWYRNQGPPSSPSWTRVEDGYMGFGGSSAVSPVSGDWNGDGDKDLITGEHWGVLRFFRNDGPSTWVEEDYAQPFDLQGGSAPALTDWDDDGDLDLLLGQAHGDVHQYTNQGDASSADWNPEGVLLTLPWTNHPHPFPTFADIDGDGDDDLFVGEGGWQGSGAGGGIYYYRNQGTASAPTWNLVDDNWLGLDVGGWSTPVFTDIDADMDLDLFIGDEGGTLTYLENVGTVTNPLWAAPINPYAGLVLGAYSAPAFFDLDQDGDLDMLVGQEDGSLASVRNTGTPFSPTWELISSSHPEIDVGEHATPVAADIDGDGDADLLVGDEDGGLNVYLYTGPGTSLAQGDAYAPGDLLKINGALRLYGPAINETTNPADITVNGSLGLMMLSDQDGNPLAARNYFMSTLLTPTGFPIQRPGRSSVGLEAGFSPEEMHYLGGHAMEGKFSLTAQLPEDLPLGSYRP
ncbi:MAG: VCBS repeat-containing protein, partial [Anaerolineales bacterium]